MTTTGMAVAFALSALTVGTVLGWILAAVALPFVHRLRWAARLLPLSLSVLLVVLQLQAFLRFEQSRSELPGSLLTLLAGIGFILLVSTIAHGVSCVRATAAVRAAWRQSATRFRRSDWTGPMWVIRPSQPVVAVVGAFRPQLFVASRVLRNCSRSEMAAIIAHEAAHVRARDPLLGLLFAFTPGTIYVRTLADELQSHWRDAAEESADQRAGEAVGHLELAAALTKIARMMVPTSPAVPTIQLISKADVARRVRRLVDGRFPAETSRSWWPTLTLMLMTLIAQTPAVAMRLHALLESLAHPY
jgi:Zn-dependent protease with chaperone function